MTLEGLLLQDPAFSPVLPRPTKPSTDRLLCGVVPRTRGGVGAQTQGWGGGPGALGQVRMIRSRRSGCSPTTKNARGGLGLQTGAAARPPEACPWQGRLLNKTLFNSWHLLAASSPGHGGARLVLGSSEAPARLGLGQGRGEKPAVKGRAEEDEGPGRRGAPAPHVLQVSIRGYRAVTRTSYKRKLTRCRGLPWWLCG